MFLALLLVSHQSQAHASQMFVIVALGSFRLVKALFKERNYFTSTRRVEMSRAPAEIPLTPSLRRSHPRVSSTGESFIPTDEIPRQRTLRTVVVELPWHDCFWQFPWRSTNPAQISLGRQIIEHDNACAWGGDNKPTFILSIEF